MVINSLLVCSLEANLYIHYNMKYPILENRPSQNPSWKSSALAQKFRPNPNLVATATARTVAKGVNKAVLYLKL